MAWFIIDYFTHNIDLISQARKNFRPQNPNDDTAITEQSDYVWDPEWSHHAFINIPQSISSQAISTISYQRDYVRVVPLTIDATPLNYNTFLPDTRNNSLNLTVIHNEILNGTRNLTQQDIQTPSHFINEEIVQTTTTTQQSISPIRPNLTTPKNTNTSTAQVTLQSTVKPSVAPKYSHMDYQTYRPTTIPSKTRRTFTRNTFAEHNYNYAHSSKTNYPPQKPDNNHISSHHWNNPMTTANSENFQTNSHPPQDRSENYPFFFNKIKIKSKHLIIRITYHLMTIIYNQIFLHRIPKNIADKEHKNLIHIIEFFLKIQQKHEINNQYKCKIQLIHNLFNQFNHKI